jgi:hypothetical protein
LGRSGDLSGRATEQRSVEQPGEDDEDGGEAGEPGGDREGRVRATRPTPRRRSSGGLSWNLIKLVVALTVIWMSLSWLSQAGGT